MLDQALTGLKVLDLSRILAGPWCTQNLADLGAQVIKVEHPDGGDDTRQWGPPYLQAEEGVERLSSYFSCCNRGKRSVAIDFAKPEGAQAIRTLAQQADVLVENFKVGTLARQGLDQGSLRALNPRLIYLSITGFGQSGPMAGKPGYDYVFQGLGGLMSYTGLPEGVPGAGPLRTGVAVVDLMTGMYATSALLAALLQRTRTGLGQYLDLALLDVAVVLNANQGASYLFSGESPRRLGNAHPSCAPYEVFECADGHLILAIGNDAQFRRFCELAAIPELANDPRFACNANRVIHLAALRERINPVLKSLPCRDWSQAFDKAGVPWGPIRGLEEVFNDPQVQHRQMVQTLIHPSLGEVRTVRNPMLSPQRLPARSAVSAPPSLATPSEQAPQWW